MHIYSLTHTHTHTHARTHAHTHTRWPDQPQCPSRRSSTLVSPAPWLWFSSSGLLLCPVVPHIRPCLCRAADHTHTPSHSSNPWCPGQWLNLKHQQTCYKKKGSASSFALKTDGAKTGTFGAVREKREGSEKKQGAVLRKREWPKRLRGGGQAQAKEEGLIAVSGMPPNKSRERSAAEKLKWKTGVNRVTSESLWHHPGRGGAEEE